MDLLEYQGKQFFAQFGIPVSDGRPVTTVDEAVAAAEAVGYPVVVKAQVHAGGRGKAGGVKLANNADEVREHAGNILGLDISGHITRILWIEIASDISEEYYVSFTLDRSAKKHLGMLSKEGGVEIEQVAVENPDAIAKIWIDPVDGLTEAVCREWVLAANLNPSVTDGAVALLLKLYTAYTDGDADLAEINPLIVKTDGKVHALDAKVTLDVVNQAGGKPANFLDIGGGANAEVMAGALQVINDDPNVKSIFINIFGGITRGEEVAKGIIGALEMVNISAPIVIRLDGTNAEEGRALLAPHLSDKLVSKPTMLEAAAAAVELAKKN